MPPTSESSNPIVPTPNYIRDLAVPVDPEPVEQSFSKPVTDRVYDEPLEVPVQAYEQRNGRPYLVDRFEIQNVWQQMGLEDDVRQVDGYVIAEIEQRDLQPTRNSYDQIVSELEGRLGVEPNLNYDVLITRLGAFVKMLVEQKEKEKLKKYYEHLA